MEYTVNMGLTIDFNPAAFDHGASEADIRKAFDTVVYDGFLAEVSITIYYLKRSIYGAHD
jgi:hypothetical protein